MPRGIHHKAVRKMQKENNVIPHARSLHRGIHVHQNTGDVKQYNTNATAKRNDHRDLLVHHQKIDDTLQDIYARAHKLEEENLSREQRIEQRWKAFERVGGAQPKPKATAHPKQAARFGFASHLEKVSEEKKEERRRGDIERKTGDIDLSKGSALHNLKDRRIKKFVKRQVNRARMLSKMGDPTPMKQSGKFDRFTGTLNLFNKTKRQVERQILHQARERESKAARPGKRGGGRGGGGGSQWDVHDERHFGSKNILRDASSQLNTQRRRRKSAKKR